MELAIQTDPLFEQVMVVGEARPFITALAVVNEAEWEKFAKEFNVDPSDDRMLMRRDIRMGRAEAFKESCFSLPAVRYSAKYSPVEGTLDR